MTQTTLDFDVTKHFHGGNPYSVLAHQKALSSSAKTKQTILGALRSAGEASCETLEGLTSLPHTTCSARISELRRDSRIVKCGTAKTKSNCSCAVYRLA